MWMNSFLNNLHQIFNFCNKSSPISVFLIHNWFYCLHLSIMISNFICKFARFFLRNDRKIFLKEMKLNGNLRLQWVRMVTEWVQKLISWIATLSAYYQYLSQTNCTSLWQFGEKAFCTSSYRATSLNLEREIIPHKRFCIASWTFRELFRDELVGIALAEAS